MVKRRLYIDGNTVYGIDEECLKKNRLCKLQERENYLLVLLCAALKAAGQLGS